MKLHENVLSLIGNTPLVRINRMVSENSAEIWAKLDDLAKLVTEIKMEENVYQAALSTGARIIQPSLMEFLR